MRNKKRLLLLLVFILFANMLQSSFAASSDIMADEDCAAQEDLADADAMTFYDEVFLGDIYDIEITTTSDSALDVDITDKSDIDVNSEDDSFGDENVTDDASDVEVPLEDTTPNNVITSPISSDVIIPVDTTVDHTNMIDIITGEMKFEYCIERWWDVKIHTYKTMPYVKWSIDGWAEDSFAFGNNEIIMLNHSSGNYLVSFAVIENNLHGIDMNIYTENSINSVNAHNVLLPGISQYDNGTSQMNVYLILSGYLSQEDISKLTGEQYVKVGVINVTVTQIDSGI